MRKQPWILLLFFAWVIHLKGATQDSLNRIFLSEPPEFSWKRVTSGSRLQFIRKPNSQLFFPNGVNLTLGEFPTTFVTFPNKIRFLLGKVLIQIPRIAHPFFLKLGPLECESKGGSLGVDFRLNGTLILACFSGNIILKYLHRGKTVSENLGKGEGIWFSRNGNFGDLNIKKLPLKLEWVKPFEELKSLPAGPDEDILAWEVEKSDFGVPGEEKKKKHLLISLSMAVLKILSAQAEKLDVLSSDNEAIQGYLETYGATEKK